jgi:integrase
MHSYSSLPLLTRLDVLVHTEKVCRIVFSFQCGQSLIFLAISCPGAFFIDIPEIVDIRCIRQKRLHGLPKLAGPADVGFTLRSVRPLCCDHDVVRKADFGADSVRPKSANTISHVEQIVRAYLVPRFGNEIAEDIKPLDIQRWLKSLHEGNGLAWTTIAKMRGVMHRIYKIGILHEHVAKNPILNVETRSKTDYKPIVITPVQTLAILKALPSPLHFTLVLTCAATALRASEMLALRWTDVLWNEGRIRISKRWANGKDGETKTEASDGYVPLHPILSAHLRSWREQSPYAEDEDDGEQEARRQPAHQHANDAFHWTQGPPSPRKNDIAVANSRIAGSREVKGRFPRWKTKPTIKARPKQNLQKVQTNERGHQSHHEDGGTDRP